ncbi:MAG: hypothetical protein ACRD4Y_11485 [Candidatus Acidiferrales bacterium]
MKGKSEKPLFTGNLEHRAGKKLSQHGVEFSGKIREVRRHPTRGFRGRKGS